MLSELKDGRGELKKEIGELKKETMHQMRVLSEDLMKEVVAQWSTREVPKTSRIPIYHFRTPARGPLAQLQPTGPAYQYGPQGRLMLAMWCSWTHSIPLSSGNSRTPGFLVSPTAEGQAVGEVTQVEVPASQPKHKSDLVEDCPDDVVKVNGCSITFVLDT